MEFIKFTITLDRIFSVDNIAIIENNQVLVSDSVYRNFLREHCESNPFANNSLNKVEFTVLVFANSDGKDYFIKRRSIS